MTKTLVWRPKTTRVFVETWYEAIGAASILSSMQIEDFQNWKVDYSPNDGAQCDIQRSPISVAGSDAPWSLYLPDSPLIAESIIRASEDNSAWSVMFSREVLIEPLETWLLMGDVEHVHMGLWLSANSTDIVSLASDQAWIGVPNSNDFTVLFICDSLQTHRNLVNAISANGTEQVHFSDRPNAGEAYFSVGRLREFLASVL